MSWEGSQCTGREYAVRRTDTLEDALLMVDCLLAVDPHSKLTQLCDLVNETELWNKQIQLTDRHCIDALTSIILSTLQPKPQTSFLRSSCTQNMRVRSSKQQISSSSDVECCLC